MRNPRSFIANLTAALLFAAAALAADPGFTNSVSTRLIAAYVQRFGPLADARLRHWIAFATEQSAARFKQRLAEAGSRDAEVLQRVNSYVNNHMRFVDDAVHWQREDYWATPAESYGSNGGDCEDYAIAKYYLLKELGVPVSRLRITYVRAQSVKQPHMVLAYYSSPSADPLILDNLETGIRQGSQRADLQPVYMFNDDEVELVQSGQRGHPSQIRAWLDLQSRLRAEQRL